MLNEVLGVIEFLSTAFREPDEELLKLVQAIGGEIGQFVERMRAEAALRRAKSTLRDQAQELELRLLALADSWRSRAHRRRWPWA